MQGASKNRGVVSTRLVREANFAACMAASRVDRKSRQAMAGGASGVFVPHVAINALALRASRSICAMSACALSFGRSHDVHGNHREHRSS